VTVPASSTARLEFPCAAGDGRADLRVVDAAGLAEPDLMDGRGGTRFCWKAAGGEHTVTLGR